MFFVSISFFCLIYVLLAGPGMPFLRLLGFMEPEVFELVS